MSAASDAMYAVTKARHKPSTITANLKVISANTKVTLATEEVITATLKVISATTKVILATEKGITATLEMI